MSRPKQKIEPIKPVLKPVMAEKSSSSEPASSTVIVVMGASVSPLHSGQGRNGYICAALAEIRGIHPRSWGRTRSRVETHHT